MTGEELKEIGNRFKSKLIERLERIMMAGDNEGLRFGALKVLEYEKICESEVN